LPFEDIDLAPPGETLPPKGKTPKGYTPDFEQFWREYPSYERRSNKEESFKLYTQILQGERKTMLDITPTAEGILAALREYVHYCENGHPHKLCESWLGPKNHWTSWYKAHDSPSPDLEIHRKNIDMLVEDLMASYPNKTGETAARREIERIFRPGLEGPEYLAKQEKIAARMETYLESLTDPKYAKELSHWLRDEF
jgi:hypothetical protein